MLSCIVVFVAVGMVYVIVHYHIVSIDRVSVSIYRRIGTIVKLSVIVIVLFCLLFTICKLVVLL